MDALSLLRKDHRDLEALFKRFERTSARAVRERKKLVRQIVDDLSLHADIEEQLFYPAVERSARATRDVMVAEEEHEVVKELMRQVGSMGPDEERFEPKVTVLIETARRHMGDEERGLFPKLRKAWKPAQLRELGERIEEAKKAIRNPRDYLRLS